MKSSNISLLGALLIFVGCNSSSPSASAGKGDGGGAMGGKGGRSGSGGSGKPNAAADAGEDTGGSSGPDSGSGAADHGFILGPATDAQEPITVGAEHAGFSGDYGTFLADTDGNVFTVSTDVDIVLHKYDASLSTTPLWSLSLHDIGSGPDGLSIAPDGGVIFGGFVVGKLDPDGKLAWKQPAEDHGVAHATALAADGSVIAVGSSTDGLPWIARYKADGTPVFASHYPDFAKPLTLFWIAPYDVFVDAENNITALDTRHTLKVDSEGTELSRTDMPMTVPGAFSKNLPIELSPTRDAFYIWSQWEERHQAFGKYSLDRTLLYYRLTEPPRFVVIDPEKQNSWQGDLRLYAPTAKRTIAIGKKSAYLVGGYANQHYDASARMVGTATVAMSVGRYDLDGNRIWFQELLLEGDPPGGASMSIQGIALDPAENPIVAAYSNMALGGTGKTFIFKLSAGDGSVLPPEP